MTNNYPQHQQFQDRLVQLSIDIEDKTKSSRLLQEAIDDQYSRLKIQINQWRLNYEKQLKQNHITHKEKHGKILDSVSEYIKEKKDLTQISEILNIKMEQNINHNRFALDIMRENDARKMKKLFQEWRDTKSERRKQYMMDKQTSVREATIKALEPEMQKLSKKQETEVKSIDIKSDVQISTMKSDFNVVYEKRISELKNRSEIEFSSHVKSKLSMASKLISDSESTHVLKKRKLLERLSDERKFELNRQEETLSKMRELNSYSVQKVEVELKKRLNLIQTKKSYELDVFLQQLVNEEKNEMLLYTSASHEWEKEKRKEKYNELDSELRAKNESINERRDTDIDSYIRHITETETSFELKLKENFESKLLEKRSKHEKHYSTIRNNIFQSMRKESTSLDQVYLIKKKKNLHDSIRIQKKLIEKLTIQIDSDAYIISELDKNYSDKSNSITRENSIFTEKIISKNNKTNDLMKEKRQARCLQSSKQNKIIHDLVKNHQSQLKKMENDIKTTLDTLYSNHEVVEEKLKQRRIRLKRISEIMFNYRLKSS